MIEEICDLWDEPADARCITTNGYVKLNGCLVMGAGVAGQAQARYPWLPKAWGSMVKNSGNKLDFLEILEDDDSRTILIAFPVKHVWYEPADLDLIKRSTEQLMSLIDLIGWEKVLLPRPGCGNGRLKWEQVKPVIEPILDDRVWVIRNGF